LRGKDLKEEATGQTNRREDDNIKTFMWEQGVVLWTVCWELTVVISNGENNMP